MSVALTTTHENSSFQRRSKKVGVEIRPNQLLIFGRGKGGPFLVKEAPLAGIDLPFKALAWENAQGKVWLSYTTGSYIDKKYAVKDAAESVKNIDRDGRQNHDRGPQMRACGITWCAHRSRVRSARRATQQPSEAICSDRPIRGRPYSQS